MSQMNTSTVAIQSVSGYDDKDLDTILLDGLDRLGGLEAIVPPRSRVFLKINHLSPPSPPEAAIVTHPRLTAGVIRILQEQGCRITVGDDISGDGIAGFRRSGYIRLMEETGIELVNLKQTGFRRVQIMGDRLDHVYFSRTALENDLIINLPKLKTHAFTIFTGSVKNMYGLIPSGHRHKYHRHFPRRDDFCHMLVDILSVCPPQLNIMDAVQAMEGEGPSGGHPIDLGRILISRDAVALDTVASELIGLPPQKVGTNRIADTRGLGNGSMDSIIVIGEDLDKIRRTDFKQSAIAAGPMEMRLPQLIHGFIQDQLILTPKISPLKCTGCDECIKICPAGAAQKKGKIAFILKSPCIHCMCCYEVCRHGAIRLYSRPVGKIYRTASRLTGRIRKLLGRR